MAMVACERQTPVHGLHGLTRIDDGTTKNHTKIQRIRRTAGGRALRAGGNGDVLSLRLTVTSVDISGHVADNTSEMDR